MQDQLSLFSEEEMAKIAPPSPPAPKAVKKNREVRPVQTKPLTPVDKEPPADRDRLVCYAGHQILFDRELSLEQIREQLERDFPELSKERVTWHWLSEDQPADQEDAEGDAQSDVPEASEQTQGGDASRTPEAAQEKPPLIVVPVVTAGKKGGVRGYFWSAVDMVQNMHPVNVLAARNGLYEVRRTPVGIFSVRVEDEQNLDVWREGFSMFLPRIPGSILGEVMDFFRQALPNEAVAEICWDRESQAYLVAIPEQKATVSKVAFKRPAETQMGTDLLTVVCIHSHGKMEAFFSSVDDEDEKATGLYAVVGRVDTPVPQLRCRYSCGGQYREIDPAWVFEVYSE